MRFWTTLADWLQDKKVPVILDNYSLTNETLTAKKCEDRLQYTESEVG